MPAALMGQIGIAVDHCGCDVNDLSLANMSALLVLLEFFMTSLKAWHGVSLVCLYERK